MKARLGEISRSLPGLGAGLLLYLMLALVAAALSPGLSGAFAIDDFGNLEDLEKITAEPTFDSALRFIFGGVSSPLGRPMAMATFAAQFHSWPGAPADFIYVNILLHLLNGCLLFWCLLRVLDLARLCDAATNRLLALATTWLWLFAAPQTGAVLYVVQRMAVLSGTFVLLGLLLYLAGRRRDAAAPGWHGTLLMVIGTGVAVGLGVLAKETAALFPLLVLCLEYTLLQGLPRRRGWLAFSAVFLWLPTAAIIADLLSYVPAFLRGTYQRDFGLGERLLTETRVLFAYLQKFLLPPLYGMRVYYDDIEISRSLLSPWTTLASLAGWTALLGAAFRLRRRAAPLSFAVLWYVAAHLLEATVIPLELAFDHRNYVALAGPAFALAWYGYRLLTTPALARVRPVVIAGSIAYASFFAIASWQAASFWGQPSELANFWANQQPGSRRAQLAAAKLFWGQHDPVAAMVSIERSQQRWPGDVAFFLTALETACAFPDLPKPDLAQIVPIVKVFDSTVPATVLTLDTLIMFAEDKTCKRYSPADLWSIVEMSFDTPKLAAQDQIRLLLLSRVALLANDHRLARELLDRAVLTPPEPVPPILERAMLLSLAAGDLACARSYLARFKATRTGNPLRTWSYESSMRELEALIDQKAGSTPPRPPDEPSCKEPGVPAG